MIINFYQRKYNLSISLRGYKCCLPNEIGSTVDNEGGLNLFVSMERILSSISFSMSTICDSSSNAAVNYKISFSPSVPFHF